MGERPRVEANLELGYDLGGDCIERDQNGQLLSGAGIAQGMRQYESTYSVGKKKSNWSAVRLCEEGRSVQILPGRYESVRRSC